MQRSWVWGVCDTEGKQKEKHGRHRKSLHPPPQNIPEGMGVCSSTPSSCDTPTPGSPVCHSPAPPGLKTREIFSPCWENRSRKTLLDTLPVGFRFRSLRSGRAVNSVQDRPGPLSTRKRKTAPDAYQTSPSKCGKRTPLDPCPIRCLCEERKCLGVTCQRDCEVGGSSPGSSVTVYTSFWHQKGNP